TSIWIRLTTRSLLLPSIAERTAACPSSPWALHRDHQHAGCHFAGTMRGGSPLDPSGWPHPPPAFSLEKACADAFMLAVSPPMNPLWKVRALAIALIAVFGLGTLLAARARMKDSAETRV